jgi:hypothetical protein
MISGFHVYEGTIKGEGGRVRQKKVDTMIAIDMLTHSFRGNMDKVTLLTGDLDFKPLIDALIQQGMYVTLWYYPLEASEELIYAADARHVLNVDDIYRYASNEFIEKYKLPKKRSKGGKNIDGYTPLKKGKIDSSIEIEIYKKENNFLALYPIRTHPVSFMHIEYHNLKSLEYYISDSLGKHIDWEKQ